MRSHSTKDDKDNRQTEQEYIQYEYYAISFEQACAMAAVVLK